MLNNFMDFYNKVKRNSVSLFVVFAILFVLAA